MSPSASSSSIAFIERLQALQRDDRGAMATLRHSLAFPPGAYPRAYPHIERHVGQGRHAQDARRLALYAVAGLFAAFPESHPRTLAAAWGQLVRDEDRPSLEMRFVALLESEADGAMAHLRQAVSLLAGKQLAFNHARLLDDLPSLLDERASPARRDAVRRQWARDFYRTVETGGAAVAAPVADTQND